MKTLLLFSLSFILVVMCSCRDKMSSTGGKSSSTIMKEDVEKIFNEKIPTGVLKSNVKDFLNTFKIGSRSVARIRDESGPSTASSVEDSQPLNIDSHIWAIILEAGNYRDGIFTTPYHIEMYFYFDKNEKLMGYHVQPMLDASF